MPCLNASKRPETAARDAPPSHPMRHTLPACCARAASGHAAIEPAITLMKSRRLMQPAPGLRTTLILFKVQPSRHHRGRRGCEEHAEICYRSHACGVHSEEHRLEEECHACCH